MNGVAAIFNDANSRRGLTNWRLYIFFQDADSRILKVSHVNAI